MSKIYISWLSSLVDKIDHNTKENLDYICNMSATKKLLTNFRDSLGVNPEESLEMAVLNAPALYEILDTPDIIRDYRIVSDILYFINYYSKEVGAPSKEKLVQVITYFGLLSLSRIDMQDPLSEAPYGN